MARLVVGAGETLRAQVATLPEMPKPQQLDGDMAQLRVQRLQFENQLENCRSANSNATTAAR